MINFSINSVFNFGRPCFTSPQKSMKVVGLFLIAAYALAKARSPALNLASYFGWNKLAKALVTVQGVEIRARARVRARARKTVA